MAYVVEVSQEFHAVQGLASPVRAARGLPPITGGVAVILRAGVAFEDEQLTARGWFFDTDAAAQILEACCARLAGQVWTELFDFRPTFELVARAIFRQLAEGIPQLAYVELRDDTFGTTTRYSPPT
jgi:hypothetical protein